MSQIKKQVSILAVLAMLESGKTRPQIKEELGLSHQEMVAVFKHEKLKGRRTRTVLSNLDIIDDTEPASSVSAAAETEVRSVNQAPAADAASNDWTTPEVAQAPEEAVIPEVVDERAPFEREG